MRWVRATIFRPWARFDAVAGLRFQEVAPDFPSRISAVHKKAPPPLAGPRLSSGDHAANRGGVPLAVKGDVPLDLELYLPSIDATAEAE